MTFVQARNYTAANRSDVRLIVIHTMENPEKPGTARAVARWFAGPLAPKASAHYCVDNAEVVQCVRDDDVAWHAPGANRDSIGIEHAGRASQDAADWADEYSRAMLRLSADLAAEICTRYDIPPRKLTVEEVRDGNTKGFCGHHDVTLAFKKSDHIDPGKGFPWDSYLEMVREGVPTGENLDAIDRSPTDPAPPPEGHPI